MIELKNVSKKFNNTHVLKDIKLRFPRYGIVVIYGPSGCGKTTLLNIISSLYDFEGEIIFDGQNYNSLDDSDKDNLRNTKIGFVFQDYKLFDLESVKSNLMLALDMKSEDKVSVKERKIKDLLKIVDLSKKENEMVMELSGGEKQRLAIARAICNSPKVLLADEPTGNLDNKNSEIVMSLLQRIAKKSLVIMVSHDRELTEKYADQIIEMEDGKVKMVTYSNHNYHIDSLPLIHIKPKEKNPKLPLSFCFHHAFLNISKRKWRTLFVLLTTSLGLFGVGLGTIISDIISTNLYKTYTSIIDSNRVVLKKKNSEINLSNDFQAMEYDEVMNLYNKYHKDINEIGVYYWNDFSTFFPVCDFHLDTNGVTKFLPSFTAQHFNEYDKISSKNLIYPNQIEETDEDEVVLGLDISTLNEICYQLKIPKSVKSLSEYLTKSTIDIIVDIENTNWKYEVSFPLHIKGFTLMKKTMFFNSGERWNEYIFEQLCSLPATEKLNGATSNPWDLKKSYYFDFHSDRDLFLEDIRFQKDYQYYVGEILDEKYYPILYKNSDVTSSNRVALLLKENRDQIESFLGEAFKESSSQISSLIYGSSSSYAIYPESLMMGFARETYLSNSEEHIDEIIDLTTYLKYEESMNINLPEGVIEGHFTKSAMQGLTFNPDYEVIEGRKPLLYSEIVVSKAVIDTLKIKDPINKNLYLAYPTSEELLPNGFLLRKFKVAGIKIVGIVDSNKNEIYHCERWTIMFFQSMIGVSSFDLSIDSVSLKVDDGQEDNVIKSFERSFPKLDAISPIKSVKDSVDSICRYIELILRVLSISSVIIAAILLTLCNHLHFLEIKKDIGLVRCLGVNRQEACKMIYSHSILMVVLSMIFAVFELFMICFILTKVFADSFSISSTFVFNPMAIIYMLGLSIIMSLISSIFIQRRVKSLDPLDCLRS